MSTSAVSSTGATTSGTQPLPVKPPDQVASKETFLQLLVAQIKNQNPLQPTDGIQFLTQLAQFSGLEQSIEMRKELEAIHAELKNLGSGSAAGNTGTSASSGDY